MNSIFVEFHKQKMNISNSKKQNNITISITISKTIYITKIKRD